MLYRQKYSIEVEVYDVDASAAIKRNGPSGSFMLGIVPSAIEDHQTEETYDAHATV